MSRASAARGFLLLEVILSLVILGMASAVLMRAYTISSNSVKKAQTITVAALLADGLVERLDMEGKFERDSGDFGEAYPGFSWRVDVKEERIRYDYVTGNAVAEDIEPLRFVQVVVTYDRGSRDPHTALTFTYHPLRIDAFSQKAKFENQIY